MRIRLLTEKSETEIFYTPPKRLSDLLARSGAPVSMPCGGRGTCLKCKVRAFGALSPMEQREADLLTAKEKSAGVRFACMTQALGDADVFLEAARPEEILTDSVLPQGEIAPWAAGLGVAVDIGTTTLAGYLYRLSDGALLSCAASRNPQRAFGADVISRIEKAMAGEQEALARSVRGGIASLIETLCADAGAAPAEIGGAVLAGNTAMQYLLCGEEPASIASAPFVPSRYFGEFVTPDLLSLPLCADAKVYLARSISAYVGGDITAALLATRLLDASKEAPVLLADIGTNGEIVLAAENRLLCCSTAAGPAFEGAGIRQGMTASAGAVCRVDYTPEGAMVSAVTGGGAPEKAAGICGSGLLDAVAAMLDAGVLDGSGRLEETGHPFAENVSRDADGGLCFTLPGTPVGITQGDIRAVQLAKAAICAGIETLLQEAGIAPESVGRLLLAGGFGNALRPECAERIGLIPPGFAAKTASVGNAAGAGAAQMLLSLPLLQESEAQSRLARTIELSADPRFMDAYVSGMLFSDGKDW